MDKFYKVVKNFQHHGKPMTIFRKFNDITFSKSIYVVKCIHSGNYYIYDKNTLSPTPKTPTYYYLSTSEYFNNY